MASKNCPNCAAPYDVGLNKCPYCGTSYFDMSCIDINSLEPFYLKLKIGDMMVTSKVVTTPDSAIEVSADYTDFELCDGLIHRVVTSKHADFDLHFTSVVDRTKPNERLFTVLEGNN